MLNSFSDFLLGRGSFACSSSVAVSDVPDTSTAPAAHGAIAAAATQIAEDFMPHIIPELPPARKGGMT